MRCRYCVEAHSSPYELSTLSQYPAEQQMVLITGHSCHRDIIELADTVSELRPVKQAFDIFVNAQVGIDY